MTYVCRCLSAIDTGVILLGDVIQENQCLVQDFRSSSEIGLWENEIFYRIVCGICMNQGYLMSEYVNILL